MIEYIQFRVIVCEKGLNIPENDAILSLKVYRSFDKLRLGLLNRKIYLDSNSLFSPGIRVDQRYRYFDAIYLNIAQYC